jgi:hypothetical protein
MELANSYESIACGDPSPQHMIGELAGDLVTRSYCTSGYTILMSLWHNRAAGWFELSDICGGSNTMYTRETEASPIMLTAHRCISLMLHGAGFCPEACLMIS